MEDKLNGCVVDEGGTKRWYRDDGPAVEYSETDKEWWVEGKEFSKMGFDAMVERSLIERKLSGVKDKPKKIKI